MMAQAELSLMDSGSNRSERAEVLHWDGRLDNRADLLLLLQDSLGGHPSNAALALAAYERWGTGGFVHLIGDWSLVIRDHSNSTTVLASDFAGVRPLYYYAQPGRVVWTSRLQSLVDEAGAEKLDEEYVRGFLLFGGCPNRTPYKGIHSVPPGHAVCVSANGTEIRRFWALPTGDETRHRNEHRYAEQLRALFREAVAVRLQTESPVLAELSGGLDSSSVVSMATRLMRSGAVSAPALTGVSYLWPNSLDEPFIREMESFCGIEGIHISTHDAPLIAEAQAGRAKPEGFQPLRSAVATIASRLGAQTILTGQSGDLMMGNWFDDSLQVAAPIRAMRLGRACREALAWSELLHIPVYRILWRAVRAVLPPALAPAAIYMAADGSYMPKSGETSLRFGSGAARAEPSFFSNGWFEASPERRKHFRNLSIMLEMRMLQPPEPLQHLDYTHPFAHRPLVEFLMSVPADVLCRPGEPRRLMRSALAELWPPRLRTRRSKGFFNGPWQAALRPLAAALLRARHLHLVELGFVNRASLRSRLERLSAGLDCHEPQLRQIILFELWLRNRAASRRAGQGTSGCMNIGI